MPCKFIPDAAWWFVEFVVPERCLGRFLCVRRWPVPGRQRWGCWVCRRRVGRRCRCPPGSPPGHHPRPSWGVPNSSGWGSVPLHLIMTYTVWVTISWLINKLLLVNCTLKSQHCPRTTGSSYFQKYVLWITYKDRYDWYVGFFLQTRLGKQ